MQFPDGRLAKPKRLFGLPSLRDIQRNADIVAEMSCDEIAHRKTTVPDPPDHPIRPNDPILVVEREAVPVFKKTGHNASFVIRMNGINERLRALIQAGAGSSPHAFIGLSLIHISEP